MLRFNILDSLFLYDGVKFDMYASWDVILTTFTINSITSSSATTTFSHPLLDHANTSIAAIVNSASYAEWYNHKINIYICKVDWNTFLHTMPRYKLHKYTNNMTTMCTIEIMLSFRRYVDCYKLEVRVSSFWIVEREFS